MSFVFNPADNLADQLELLAWPADGLLPLIVQHAISGKILMQGYANSEALQ